MSKKKVNQTKVFQAQESVSNLLEFLTSANLSEVLLLIDYLNFISKRYDKSAVLHLYEAIEGYPKGV